MVAEESIGKVMELSESELWFYSRQIVLSTIGYTGQVKLRNAKVCIIGLGGLGSPAALELAAMGVGHLRLVDYDVVDLSNLQRQILYSANLVRYPKVEAAAQRLRDLNPHITIEPVPLSVNTNNAERIIENMDVVVDGLDLMTPRYTLNRACQTPKTPYLFGAAIMNYGNVSTIIPGKTLCLECFQGNIDDATVPKCSVVGVHPSVLNIIASIEVAETVRLILGQEPRLANKMLHCDIENMTFETINLSKAENCPVCSDKPIGTPMPLHHKTITEICSRGGKRSFVILPKNNLELDMEQLSTLLMNEEFGIQVKAKLGVTFHDDSKRRVSILKSGIMIIEGVINEPEAYDVYKKIIVEGLLP